jgi:hypothetical protein
MTSSPAAVRTTWPCPVEQARVELLFQLLDLEGHRGLGHEQRFGSPGEGSVAGNRVENLKSTISHGS